jgi:hypothetical protein
MSSLIIRMVSNARFLGTSWTKNVKELLLMMCFGPMTSHPTNVLLYPNGDNVVFMVFYNHPPKVWIVHALNFEWPQRWKHTRKGQKCCHIVLFSRGVHVWTSTMVILQDIFPNFLHNMVDYNTKNSIAKKIPFSNLYCVIPKYICGEKMYVIMY